MACGHCCKCACCCCCRMNPSEPPNDFRQCYCCSNIRTALYTMWLHRKHNIFLTLVQILLPIGILASSNCIHQSLLPVHQYISSWTQPPAISETEILESVKCKENCYNYPWIFFTPENDFTRQIVRLSLKYFYSAQVNMTLDKKIHFLVNQTPGFDYGLVKYLGKKEKYLIGVVKFHEEMKNLDPESNITKVLNYTVYLASKIPHSPQPATGFSYDGNDVRHYMPLMGVQLALSKAYDQLISSKLNPKPEGDNETLSTTSPMMTTTPASTGMSESNSKGLAARDNYVRPVDFKISIQQFPYPPHNLYNTTGQSGDEEQDDSAWVIPTALVLGFTMVILTFSEGPVSHKESGFKLELHMMGMSSSLFWGGWIINQFFIQLITVSLQTYILFIPICGVKLVSRGTPSLWLLVLIAYNMASLSFMAFVSAFFKRCNSEIIKELMVQDFSTDIIFESTLLSATMCTYVGATIWLLSFYFVMIHWPTYTQFWFRLISCALPNAALLWAVNLLMSLGGDWDSLDLFINDPSQDGVNLISVIIMMFADSLIYFFLIPYIDHIRPGPFEVIQPWNYFFERWVCRPKSKNKNLKSARSKALDIENNDVNRSRSTQSSSSKGLRQPDSEGDIKLPSVEFVDISKKYRRAKDVYAVDNVNFKVYPGKITVMLGHSGSGKTTLIRLLCGEYYPTKGTAYVLGLDVRYHRIAITHLMSVCFERNLLSNYLTALEHLILIGILKGMSRKDSIKRAHKLLTILEIGSIKNYRMSRLLEHEKRLLSVALALIGKSPVIVLDEVTEGLDPNIKRLVWNALKNVRSPDCTIIYFTSDMDEAYYVGDRIAIMSKGKIVGSGSSARLEQLFGTGYHLKLLLEPGTDKSPIFDLVKDCIESTEELESRLVRMNKAIQLVNKDEEDVEEPFVQPTASASNAVVVNEADEGVSVLHYLTFGLLGSKAKSQHKGPNPSVSSPIASQTTDSNTDPNPIPPPTRTSKIKIQNPKPPSVSFINEEDTKSKKVSVKKSHIVVVPDTGAFRRDPRKSSADDTNSSSSDLSLNEPVELILLLPKNESKHFKKLFSFLQTESVKKAYGIKNYRLKSYTMKQAFDEVDEYLEIEKVENSLENKRRSSISNSTPSKEKSETSKDSKSSLKNRESYINEKIRTVIHDNDDITSKPLPLVPRGTSCWDKFCRSLQVPRGLLKRRLMWITGGWIYSLVQIVVPILLLVFLMQATRDYYAPQKRYSRTRLDIDRVFRRSSKIHVPIVIDDKDHEPFQENKTALLKHYRSQLGRQVKIDNLRLNRLGNKEFYSYVSNLKVDTTRKEEDWNSTTLLDSYLYEYVVIGVDFRDISNPIGLYSPSAFHGPTLSILALINTRFAYLYPQHKFSMKVTSHPMQYKKQHLELLRFSFTESETSEAFYDFEQCFIFAVLLGYGFFIFTSGFAAQPTTERFNLFKRLQLNTGITSFSYWFCLFSVDFFFSLVLGGIMLLIIWFVPGASAQKSFSNPGFAKYFSMHWILSSYTSILYSYIFSFYLRRGSTAYFATLSINQFFGLFAFILTVTLKEFTPGLAGPITFAMHFLHPFTIPAGFYSIANVAIRNGLCRYMTDSLREKICSQDTLVTSAMAAHLSKRYQASCCRNHHSCLRPGVTDNCPIIQPYITFDHFFKKWGNLDNATMTFCFIIFHALVATFILFVVELNINLRRVCCRKKTSAKEGEQIRKLSITVDEELMAKFDKDETVRKEKVDVETCLRTPNGQTHELILNELSLQLKNRQLLTDISLVADPGELCGIIGPKGSGKTKLFRILANDIYPSEGNAHYSGFSLADRNTKDFLRRVGFCLPGKDFVFRRISGREVVRLFGRLRGVPEKVLKQHVEFWLDEFGLTHEASGNCEYFSDSTKQRLSLACCFIGDPEIVILDDPLPSLDPEGRLQFWTVVDKVLDQDRIILMTSSSMETVQNHCSKIAIMVNGALKHVTTPYKLVEEFGLGTSFTFIVYLKPDLGQESTTFEQYTELKGRVKNVIPNVVLQKEMHFSLRYQIEECDMQLSDLFGLVDEISVYFAKIIKDYELRETSMEDIYDTFALRQNKYRIEPTTFDTFCSTYC